jgi:hypothetical protein
MVSGVLSVLYVWIGIKLYYFVKSYLQTKTALVFSESANSNKPYFATGAGLCFKRLFMDLWCRAKDDGLKYNKGLLQSNGNH